MKPTRDESKLPKWAQRELDRLRRDSNHYRTKLSKGPEDSVVFANPFSEAPTPLGDADIEFRLSGTKIRVRIDGDVLDVNGGTRLAVIPRASNSFVIRVDER